MRAELGRTVAGALERGETILASGVCSITPPRWQRLVLGATVAFRTRFYWAQLIQIALVTPLSFVLNKIWTFSSVRSRPALPPAEDEAPAEPARHSAS